MNKTTGFLLALVIFAITAHGTDFYVATNGDNANPGTETAPFRTIQHAADLAQPGDVITVRGGIYRERVNPPRGGKSDRRRIVYQAAPGQTVVITGSEAVTNWMDVQGDVWKTTIPNSFFGSFNPYTNVLHGDWFSSLGRVHHTGAVYLNGNWLTEATNLDEIFPKVSRIESLNQIPSGDVSNSLTTIPPLREGLSGRSQAKAEESRGEGELKKLTNISSVHGEVMTNETVTNPLWFGQVDATNTTIWAQFRGINPNQQQVEINARQTVFYPEKTGINYITVRGFTMEDAATPWSPPTAEQIGLIGTHWSKGWIIESNIIRYSICAGVTLGKYGDEWDNKAGTARGYVGTIDRALTNGWNGATIGHHIVRDNDISHCEQAGVVGSLGGAFSTITGNNIHDIHVMNWFSGAEMAGIKLHGGIDVEISHNHIARCWRGIWMDWMAQGARITGNLFDDNGLDIAFEVDHGPFLVDNNIFLSRTTIAINSQGGAFVHNLFAGAFQVLPLDGRLTPYFKAHSTKLAGLHNSPTGDSRFYNNIFVQRPDLGKYNKTKLPVWMDGNVFLDGAKPCKLERNPIMEPDFDPALQLIQKADGCYLQMKFDDKWISERQRKLVTSKLLGRAAIPNLPFTMPNGKAVRVATDYFGNPRNVKNPTPGPFENPGNGELLLKAWPQ